MYLKNNKQISIDKDKQVLFDPDELPITTPEMFLYSSIRSNMLKDIERFKLSLDQSSFYFGIAKHTILKIIKKETQIPDSRTFLPLAIAYNIDIDNFNFPIYQKNHKQYPDITKIKLKKIIQWLNLGLKRNLEYRVYLYGSSSRIAKNTYMQERTIYNFIDGTKKSLTMTNTIRLAIYMKKNLKRIIYDGSIYHTRFKPFSGKLSTKEHV